MKRDEAAYHYIDAIFRFAAAKGVGKAFIEANGGPTTSTLRKWEKGKVRSPQLVTIRFALRALGKDLAVVDRQDHNF